MFYLIGLGLGSEEDITVRGLNAVKSCSKIFLEAYTSVLGVNKEALEAYYGKTITLADREFVESGCDGMLDAAKEEDVALLVVGDALCATTHTDLFLRAREMNIRVEVIHNASIMNAVAVCGLQLYRFGQTVSLPLFEENWKPASFYDKIQQNYAADLHTLCLLDIKMKEPNIKILETRGKIVYDPPRFMSVKQAIEQLLYIEEEVKKAGVLSRTETRCVGVARLGQPDQRIVSGTLEELLEVDMGEPLHSLVLVASTHPLEDDMLKFYAAKKE